MTPEPPLHFAGHLLAFAVGMGAALVVLGGRGRTGVGRTLGALGFLALAAGEAVHGASFGEELSPLPAGLRSVGYGLVLVAAVAGPARRPAGVVAALALPLRAAPAGLAWAGALAAAWREWRGRGGPALAVGLALLAGGESVLAAGDPAWAPDASLALRTAGYLGVAWFVFRAVHSSIRYRFAAAMVALLVVVVLVVSSAVSSVLTRNVREAALDRVASQATEAQSLIAPLVREEAGRLVVVASADEAVTRFRRGLRFSRAEMASLKESLFPGVDFILFLSKPGTVLGRVGLSGGEALEVVAATFREGQEVASLDVLGADRLVIVAGAPVRFRDRVLGAVVAGRVVDHTVLERITAPGSWAFVFRRAHPVPVAVKGFQAPPGEALVGRSRLQPLWERFLVGAGTVRGTFSLAGTDAFGALAPLERSDGEPLGMLMVAEPASAVLATQQELNRLLFLATAALVALAFLLAALVSRRITRPVVALTHAARRVGQGDLEARSEVRGDDEVGELAKAFDHMTGSLAAMTSRLRASAEEEARLRNRLETVVNSMGDGLLAVDEAGRVATCNPAAAEILGRPRDALVGKSLGGVLDIRDAEDNALDPEGDLPPGLAFVARPDGRRLPVAIVSSRLRGGSGAVVGRVLVMRDMSREHEVERMKTEFLSNVSHELRTPLTPIIGYAEIMSGKQVPPERAQQFAESILSSANRLERIVAILLDFAAMEGGRMSLSPEAAPLRPLVQKAVEDWRERSDRHRFVARFDPEVPEALVDVRLIRRAIDEVLDNAVKYSPDGGTVTVTVASENSRKRRMVRLEVRDEGIGIAPEELPRIFEDFRQVDASDTRSFGGLGLGLAFVKRIVEAHRGTITATSLPGQGTAFSLLLPAADTGSE